MKEVKPKGCRYFANAVDSAPDDVGGYTDLASGTPPIDTDHDGMSDDWEIAVGLDRNDPADGNLDHDSDGYTNRKESTHSEGRS